MNTARAPTALIVEDESVLRRELRELLAQLWPELELLGEAGTGIEAVRLLERRIPDVLFLDIQMPGMSGLDVARHVQGRCHVVFTTAYDAYAVAAFEAGAVDYVLKPVQAARLATAIERVKQRLATAPAPARLDELLQTLSQGLAGRNYLRWINATTGQNMRVITTDEVAYFQADTKYTRVVTSDGEALVRMSLRQLQEQLDPSTFWQVHRSTIVNANAIASVARDFRGHVFLLLKQRPERLAVSEPYHHLFRQM
ncbi:MAG: response regulator transcription factor [Gammaproteobacteria bacterium]|nr:response regulator transcription factor [Gammaproteobacteria bacterium]